LAQYYQAVGKYELALQQYECLTKVPKAPAPNKHIGLQLECAQLLTQMGRTEEAYRIYQKANRQKDSLNALSYARQINDLRGMYQIDRMEIRNQIQRNQIILWIIIASIFILMLVLLLIVRIRQESNRLLRSKEELEIARKYAENSIRTKSLFLSNMSHEICVCFTFSTVLITLRHILTASHSLKLKVSLPGSRFDRSITSLKRRIGNSP